jgi:hypothetical protein
MKRTSALVIIFSVLSISATVAWAQTNAPRKKTVWVPPPMGSHLGGGFVATEEVDKQSTSKLGGANDNTALGIAIAKLDAKAGTIVEGQALMPTAVSWQTKVPVEVLKKQRAKSGLTYGQLLVANSLATGSGKSFDQILALKAKSQNWTQLTEKLHVGVGSIVARVKAADDSVTYAEARRKLRRDQSIDATDFQRGGRSRVPGGG